MCSGVIDRSDHSLYASVAKAARNKDSVYIAEDLSDILLCYKLGVDPLDLNLCLVGNAGMLQCLNY